MPFSQFQKTKAYKTWEHAEGAVNEFIAKNWPKLTKVDHNALMLMLVGLRAESLKSANIPVGVQTVALTLHFIPETFDRAFPGYRETGLAPLVLKAMVHR